MYEGVMCCVCGKKQAEITWMCRECYDKLEYEFKDKPKKGHKSAKESHPQDSKTLEILSECLKGNKTQIEIAKDYGVSRQWVSYIIRRYRKEMNHAADRCG